VSRSRARAVIEAWADRCGGAVRPCPASSRSSRSRIAARPSARHPAASARPDLRLPHHAANGPAARLDRSFRPRPLFAAILEFESASERVVLRGEHWTAFVPFAARWQSRCTCFRTARYRLRRHLSPEAR
jgi:UDPglucose--hexose-1-phosphate uridylyltransferase